MHVSLPVFIGELQQNDISVPETNTQQGNVIYRDAGVNLECVLDPEGLSGNTFQIL